MADMDITLFFNELRVRALADALGNQTAETVEDKLTEAFDMLYQEYIPDEQRAAIEAQITDEEAAEQDRMEAARHFAVYHIRENGKDYHFTSDYFQTAMQAAYRYRRYARGELSDEYKTFADAFVETQPISLEKFGEICTDMNSDKRVTALVEFDLDNGYVSICDSSDNAWWCYSLHDFSVAAFKAFRSEYRSMDCRREIFNCSLAGKEIFPPEETTAEIHDEDEDEALVMRM